MRAWKISTLPLGCSCTAAVTPFCNLESQLEKTIVYTVEIELYDYDEDYAGEEDMQDEYQSVKTSTTVNIHLVLKENGDGKYTYVVDKEATSADIQKSSVALGQDVSVAIVTSDDQTQNQVYINVQYNTMSTNSTTISAGPVSNSTTTVPVSNSYVSYGVQFDSKVITNTDKTKSFSMTVQQIRNKSKFDIDIHDLLGNEWYNSGFWWFGKYADDSELYYRSPSLKGTVENNDYQKRTVESGTGS